VDVLAGTFFSSNSVKYAYLKPIIDNINPPIDKPNEQVEIIGQNFGILSMHFT